MTSFTEVSMFDRRTEDFLDMHGIANISPGTCSPLAHFLLGRALNLSSGRSFSLVTYALKHSYGSHHYHETYFNEGHPHVTGSWTTVNVVTPVSSTI